MTTPTPHDPYPHLREAADTFLLDCTKALAAFLAGDPKPLVVLVATALAGGADLLADEAVAKAWKVILGSVRAEEDDRYQRDSAAVAGRALVLGEAVRKMTGKDLEEQTALEILDRAGVSSAEWLFDENGVQGVQAPGIVASFMAGGQALLDLVAKMEAQTRPAPFGGGKVGAAPPMPVPRPVVPTPYGADVGALRILAAAGAVQWWVNDDEPDAAKRYREAVLAIAPATVDAYEAMFGKLAHPGDARIQQLSPEEIWGPALSHVNDLRHTVADLLMTPEQVAKAFVKAADILIDQCGAPGQPPRPVALALFEQGRFQELVRLALPNSTPAVHAAIADEIILAVANNAEAQPDVSGAGKEIK